MSSHWINELFNLPSLVLKARHLSGSAFCKSMYIGVPEQALGWLPLGLGLEMNLLSFHVLLYISQFYSASAQSIGRRLITEIVLQFFICPPVHIKSN